MFRGTLAVVGMTLLLVAAGVAGVVGPAAANVSANSAQDTNRTDGGQTISVAASGQAQGEPDQAIVRVAVVASGDDGDAVRADLAENASRMRAALAEVGIPDDRIRTVAYSIDQRRDTETTADRERRFEGFHAFEVTVSNVTRAGPVIDAAVSNGADRVDSVELALSEERRRAVRAAALRDAMDNARGNADVLAESADLEITGVHSVSTGDVTFEPFRAQALEAEDAGGSSTDIESGPVTVTAQVQVTYNATG
ncbi:SIMPL domain-containing protein [Halorussus salilacus]|uniref:SIMPL domain-containing protein n=1 Tax=Halorussus salilacus TaxID=2953750 RepID=UPI00209F7A77|nr:SIMPL domain-containing protein [Halorussus salilacus]USZ69456.1 SIMPL domain-containing protein [Halorussus salilacus]